MNYLEHETKVKLMDGLLVHSQEWQWIIDELQERFEVKTIYSWDDYIAGSGPLRRVFEYFVKILGICNKEWVFYKRDFYEVWEIAKFYIGSIDICDCMEEITSAHCQILLLCVWITKLENGSNGSNYLYDIRLLGQRNYFKLIKCDSILTIEDKLMDYAKKISITGLEAPMCCLYDNLHQVEYSSNINFLLKHEKEILNYNAFDYHTISGETCKTWQEVYLLDMLQVSIKDRKIQPIFSRGSETVPDISTWNENILYELKKYFNHIIANFVLETILYIGFNIEPTKEVKMLHCRLLLEALNLEVEYYKIINSSSYQVLSYLHKDKLMQECNKETNYSKLLCNIQMWKKPAFIMKIKEDGYPVSKEQRIIVSEFLTNKFKEIDNVNTINELLKYLKDETTTKKITMEYLQRVNDKFEKFTNENTDIVVSSIYYEYMIFLLNVNKNCQNVDKRVVQKKMICLQKKWQDSVYEKQCKKMHQFSVAQDDETKKLERFSDISLMNPIIFAQNCIPCSEKEILDIMLDVSETPLAHLFRGMILSPIFPTEKDRIIYERHDIDKMLLQYVEELKRKKEYKLRNTFEAKMYVADIHERYKLNTQSALSMFMKEEELYNTVKESTSLELLQYSNDVSLALLTQLFPVLEVKIRELVTLFGIFPFKKNIDEFMQYNDPSALLRELLIIIYNEQNSFENVPDLLFVYNIMYNGNSCNVRNECIHGRNYLYGGGLRFAFRATLFSIYMVEFRIKTIKENVSDIIEIV